MTREVMNCYLMVTNLFLIDKKQKKKGGGGQAVTVLVHRATAG